MISFIKKKRSLIIVGECSEIDFRLDECGNIGSSIVNIGSLTINEPILPHSPNLKSISVNLTKRLYFMNIERNLKRIHL